MEGTGEADGQQDCGGGPEEGEVAPGTQEGCTEELTFCVESRLSGSPPVEREGPGRHTAVKHRGSQDAGGVGCSKSPAGV